MDDKNQNTKKKDYDPQKDFIIETPQIIEEIIHVKNTNKNNIYSNISIKNSNNINCNKNQNDIYNNNSDIIIKKYEKGKFLGQGGFAKCYEMKSCDSNRFFAAKVFEKFSLINSRSQKKLINEIKLHKKLRHDNIVNFEHFFEDKENVYILLELCTNQTLNELIKRRKRLTDLETQFYSRQIIYSLKYIHERNIIHRDLKLGNLFLDNNLSVKLGDFGLAAKIKYPQQRRKTICGTPNYIAPEILEKKNGHSFEVDIWSLGVIMYIMKVGKPPFENPEINITYKKIKLNDYSFPENLKIERKAKNLIERILVLDPSKRPTLDEILSSEYFSMYETLPQSLPIANLALPPTKSFIDKYLKREKIIEKSLINLVNNSIKYNENKDNQNDNYVISENFENNKIINDINNLDNDKKNPEKNKLLLIPNANENILNNNLNLNKNASSSNVLLYNSDNINLIDKKNIHNINNSNTCNQNIYLRNSINKFNNMIKQETNNYHKDQKTCCNTESSSNNNLNNKNFHNVDNNINNYNENDLFGENKEENNVDKIANDLEILNVNTKVLSILNSLKNKKANNEAINKKKSTMFDIKAAKNIIINNNFFFNVGNMNNMELKIDETLVKKISGNCKIIINKGEELMTKNDFIQTKKDFEIKENIKINKKTIIKKILEYGNISLSKGINSDNCNNSNKISLYVFNISNAFLGIYFSDNTNLIKNFDKKENSKSQFFYIDNQTDNPIKFDSITMENYLNKKNGISEELFTKFKVMLQFNNKYEDYFLEKIKNDKNYDQTEANMNLDKLYIKKKISSENAVLLKLSNKILQVFFIDNSKLAMTTNGEEVLYQNKKTKNKIFDSMKNIVSNENEEIIEKIKYAKYLMVNFVKKIKR